MGTHKPLAEQVIVIVGASSGIGRETALRLAAAGAQVVVVARGGAPLRTLVAEIERGGGTARHAMADVTELAQVQRVVALTEQWFGRIDTWVHCASVLLVSDYASTTPDEFRRVLEINVMGQVHGALAAIPALTRAGGGAFIAVTSAEAYLSLPFHSAYAASKHAAEGYLDALRRELIAERAPITITTIRPAVIDTPIYRLARNHLGREARALPPFYDPVVVARCIEYAAKHPVRNLQAGGAASLMRALQWLAPSAVDYGLGRFGPRFMLTDEPVTDPEGNLERSRATGRIRGGLPRPGRRRSVSTWLATHPRSRRLLAVAVVGAALAVTRVARRDGQSRQSRPA